MMKGYFEIGIYQPKYEENIGTLMRSAYQLGAAGVFTVGKRYRKQVGDVFNICLLYTSPSPRDGLLSRMPSSA